MLMILVSSRYQEQNQYFKHILLLDDLSYNNGNKVQMQTYMLSLTKGSLLSMQNGAF